MTTSDKLGPYTTHGFVQLGQTGDQVYGDCIFCGASMKFYISTITGMHDCKVCGKEGNSISWLRSIMEHYQKMTKRKHYRRLSRLRKIPPLVFKRWGLAWDGEQWLLPCLTKNGMVRDIRRWSGNRVQSTKGCKTQLFGAHNIPQKRGSIFLCEGEWDAMILDWLLRQYPAITSSGEEWCVVAVPGASIFKSEWVDFFEGHEVCLCYDSDGAGRKGLIKAMRKLHTHASEIHMIEWPEALDDGFDVRDFILMESERGSEPENILEKLKRLVTRAHYTTSDGLSVVTDKGSDDLTEGIAVGSNSVSFREVLNVFGQHVAMTQDMEDALKISCAVGFANEIPGTPLWMYIVGPSGCGKTLALLALRGSNRCRFVSSFSPKSLVSGFRDAGADPSLLPKWDKTCVVLKDFTEILAMRMNDKDDVYSVLRGAYDGEVQRGFGNGLNRHYKDLSFSMLAGVTPAIHGEKNASLGERFLKFEMFPSRGKGGNLSSHDAEILRAISNVHKEVEMQHALEDVVGRFLAREVPEELPIIPKWMVKRIVGLAKLTGLLRANVDRDGRNDHLWRYRPRSEVATRLGKQLAKLTSLLMFALEKDCDEKIYRLIRRVAFSTTIGLNLETFEVLMRVGGQASLNDLIIETQLPRTTLRRTLEDLQAVGAIIKLRSEFGRGPEEIHRKKSFGRKETFWTVPDQLKKLYIGVSS